MTMRRNRGGLSRGALLSDYRANGGGRESTDRGRPSSNGASCAAWSSGRNESARNMDTIMSIHAMVGGSRAGAGWGPSNKSCKRRARSASRGAVHMARSSVSEITGNSRITRSKSAVNCILREGRTRSLLDPHVGEMAQAVIKARPRSSHTQLRKSSTPAQIVIEACTANLGRPLRVRKQTHGNVGILTTRAGALMIGVARERGARTWSRFQRSSLHCPLVQW